MLILELYCTDWTTGAEFGHSGLRSSLFDINSLHRIVLSNILQGRTLWEGERESSYERHILHRKEEKKSLGHDCLYNRQLQDPVRILLGSIGDRSMKLPSL